MRSNKHSQRQVMSTTVFIFHRIIAVFDLGVLAGELEDRLRLSNSDLEGDLPRPRHQCHCSDTFVKFVALHSRTQRQLSQM